MLAATPKTPTASWDASPVGPTIPSPWRHSATVGEGPTAPIRASRPVSDHVSYQWKEKTDLYGQKKSHML